MFIIRGLEANGLLREKSDVVEVEVLRSIFLRETLHFGWGFKVAEATVQGRLHFLPVLIMLTAQVPKSTTRQFFFFFCV